MAVCASAVVLFAGGALFGKVVSLVAMVVFLVEMVVCPVGIEVSFAGIAVSLHLHLVPANYFDTNPARSLADTANNLLSYGLGPHIENKLIIFVLAVLCLVLAGFAGPRSVLFLRYSAYYLSLLLSFPAALSLSLHLPSV